MKLQILAYVLQQNGFPAGQAELPGDVNALEDIGIQQRGVWDGIFTTAQADLGKQSAGRCQGCHGPELAGTDRAPALKGNAFLADFEDGSVNRLFVKIRDGMPPGNVDSLPPETKLNIVAHLLRENGFPAGSSELTMMMKRSNHMPTFTRSEMTKTTTSDRRTFVSQKSCGTSTLQLTMIQ